MAGGLIGGALWLGAGSAWAQQAGTKVLATPGVSFFKVTGVEGYAQLRAWRDSNSNTTAIPGADPPQQFGSSQALANRGGEFFVMTHSYVYHPNLLSLDLGAGPVFERQGYEINGSESKSSKSTYNLTARAEVLHRWRSRS